MEPNPSDEMARQASSNMISPHPSRRVELLEINMFLLTVKCHSILF